MPIKPQNKTTFEDLYCRLVDDILSGRLAQGVRHEPALKHELADFDKLKTWYYTDADQTIQPWTLPGAGHLLKRLLAGWMKPTHCLKHGVVYPVAIVLNATIAMVFARTMQ